VAPSLAMGRKIDNGDYVREYYQVPAYKGQDITWRGRRARILGFDLAYLHIELIDIDPLAEGGNETVVHPTWEVDYGPAAQTGEHPAEHQTVEYDGADA